MSFVVPEGYVVFSKNVCPNCVTLKNKLNYQSIPYTEIKLEDTPEALTFLKEQGFRSVPVLMLDGKVVTV
jgi:glutaredoxin-like protein NrdH